MPDRRLVVAEADPNAADFGKMFAVAPNVATGIPIPAFKFGAALPTVGTLIGEAFYELSSKKGYVWTGAAWREIAANPLATYTSDTLLLADTTQPIGTYAISTATGNLFVKRTTGWHFVGVQEFATVTQLLAAAPTTGALAVALDEDSLWIMTSTGWRSLSVRHFADTAALLAWANPAGTPAGTNPAAAHTGDQAVADDVEVMYSRTANGWVPVSIYSDTEATIRAATWPIAGQEAISIDTGRTFSFTGTSWVEEPIQHFATEVALLATTPQNGVLAWADDTAMAFTRSGGTWHRLGGGITSTVSPTAPSDSASVAGDLWINSAGGTNELKIFDGTKFISTTGSSLYQHNARVVLPGYFNKLPSATESNDDEGGIAFQYYGTHYRLFVNKGSTWHPTAPWIGDANNANKVCIADADGCPTWGDPLPPADQYVSVDTYKYSEVYIANFEFTKYMNFDGVVMNDTRSCDLDLGIYTGGTSNAPTDKITQTTSQVSGQVWNYGDGGVKSTSKRNSADDMRIVPSGSTHPNYDLWENSAVYTKLRVLIQPGKSITAQADVIYECYNHAPITGKCFWTWVGDYNKVTRVSLTGSRGHILFYGMRRHQ